MILNFSNWLVVWCACIYIVEYISHARRILITNISTRSLYIITSIWVPKEITIWELDSLFYFSTIGSNSIAQKKFSFSLNNPKSEQPTNEKKKYSYSWEITGEIENRSYLIRRARARGILLCQ